MIIPDDHLEGVCRRGQGAATCAFIIMVPGSGFECAKGTPFEAVLRQRRDAGQLTAQGDNCPGLTVAVN